MINIAAPRNLLPVSPSGNETNSPKTPEIPTYKFKDHINLNYRLTDLLENTQIDTLTEEDLIEINEQLRRSEQESLGALKKYAEDGNIEAIELIVQLYVFRDVENEELSAGLSSLVKEVYEKNPSVVVEIARELTTISLESVGKDGDFRFDLKAEVNQRLSNQIINPENMPILLNTKYSLRAAELWHDAAKLMPGQHIDIGDNKFEVRYDELLEARAAVLSLKSLTPHITRRVNIIPRSFVLAWDTDTDTDDMPVATAINPEPEETELITEFDERDNVVRTT